MGRPLKACSRCGSLEIRPPSLRDGGVPGASEIAGVYCCRRCGKRMVPILFDSERSYRKFLRQIRIKL